ncbi:MAG: thiolase family protein, partial [Chloroflexota bacterium]|nr:thiolase family protein [Chloroflexota bacterium]
RAALERTGVAPDDVDEVVMGEVGQAGDPYNARRCALEAGLPVRVTAMNVNRLCGSGLQAIWSAAQSILTGQAEIVVAGGDENMTRQPFMDLEARNGYRLGDRSLHDGALLLVTDPFSGLLMGATAECVAERYGASREEQDRFALASQRKAAAAIEAGRFADEIVPVQVTDGRKTQLIDQDEQPRPDSTLEALAALRPVFKEGGTVTAGNSSAMNDAAAVVVVTSEAAANARGLTPRLRLVEVAAAGNEPELMGYAPTYAVRKLLAKVKMRPSDVDLVELNEAFAAQSVPVIRDAELDPERVNPNGGAIALGHPVGATGCILTIKAMHELRRRSAEYAIVSMCIGGGQALAALFQNAG